MKTSSLTFTVLFFITFFAFRFVKDAIIMNRWKDILDLLQNRHYEWCKELGSPKKNLWQFGKNSKLWNIVIFHPNQLPPDNDLRLAARKYRRGVYAEFIYIVVLVLILVSIIDNYYFI